MKGAGGLQDILECQKQKSDEQTLVEVELIINGKRNRMSLGKFKELLFKEEKPVIINNISTIINNDDYKEKYGIEMIQEFIDYWTEMMPNGKKQRWQKEKAFDVNRRLITWSKRDYNGLFKEHKVQLEKRRQDEYLRQADQDAFMTPEEQKLGLVKLTQGLFKNANEEV